MKLLVCAALALTTTIAHAHTFSLEQHFNNAWPSPSLNDAGGSSTGFTSRLPGTGASIPVNDPNLELKSGYLQFSATSADDPSTVDMPSVAVTFHASDYALVQAGFTNINLDSPLASLGAYIGTDWNNVLFVGAKQLGVGEFQYFARLVVDGTATELPVQMPNGVSSVYPAGTSISFLLGRVGPSAWVGGAIPYGQSPSTFAFSDAPFLSNPTLHIGVFHLGSDPAVAELDHFLVAVVPEPSTYVLATLGIASLLLYSLRPRL